MPIVHLVIGGPVLVALLADAAIVDARLVAERLEEADLDLATSAEVDPLTVIYPPRRPERLETDGL